MDTVTILPDLCNDDTLAATPYLEALFGYDDAVFAGAFELIETLIAGFAKKGDGAVICRIRLIHDAPILPHITSSVYRDYPSYCTHRLNPISPNIPITNSAALDVMSGTNWMSTDSMLVPPPISRL